MDPVPPPAPPPPSRAPVPREHDHDQASDVDPAHALVVDSLGVRRSWIVDQMVRHQVGRNSRFRG